jgi:tetraacyldisaccharide-1-P 4'-kinase
MQDVTLSLIYSEQGLAEDVLCTEKDAVKLWARYPHVWAVPLVANLPRSLTDHIDALVLASVRQPSTTRVQR